MNPSLHNRFSLPEEDILTSITKQEAEFICNFVRDKALRRTLEVGFAYGFSTAYIMCATQSRHYAIDPYQHEFNNMGLKNIAALDLDNRLIFINDFSHNALPRLVKDGIKIDFAFIDGGHKYDEIFVDFYYVDLLLENRGYVLLHDSWMRSTQLVASWIKHNKANYRIIKTPVRNFIIFRKIGNDNREWDHFKEFYTYKSTFKYNKYKMRNSPFLSTFLKLKTLKKLVAMKEGLESWWRTRTHRFLDTK